MLSSFLNDAYETFFNDLAIVHAHMAYATEEIVTDCEYMGILCSYGFC